MSDDLDDLLRRTMKTLDEQVPSGYFEDLPAKTLARLEGPSSMETSLRTIDKPVTAAPVPPVAPVAPVAHDEDDPTAPTPREEDSGLHDIRNLAQTTKRRLKSTGANPAIVEDVSASSSSWKHVALPEPAKMVSLPDLDQLPSKEEVLAKEQLAQRAHETPGVVSIREPFSRPATKKSRAPLAIIGIGLAAAAGIAIFMVTQNNADKAEPQLSAASKPDDNARDRGATVHRVETVAAPAAGSASAQIAADTTTTDSADATAAAAPEGLDKTAVTTPPVKAVVTKGGHSKTKDTPKDPKPDKTKPTGGDVGSGAGASTEIKKTDTKKGGGGKEGEPSFDDLLKEAGVGDKKVEKPKLDKKSLSEADFKHGIESVKSKAQACYKGTQGTATVKLTIAPSGSVSKVSVGGLFAGKPEADCVANAVKSASFAPWDGGPQSFTYAYLLSE